MREVRIVDGEVVTVEGTSSGHQQDHEEKTAKSLPAVASQLKSRATRDATVCCAECGRACDPVSDADVPITLCADCFRNVQEHGFGGIPNLVAAGLPDPFLLELRDTMTDVAGLLAGWHQDGTAWSAWDQTVYERNSAALRKVYDRLGVHARASAKAASDA